MFFLAILFFGAVAVQLIYLIIFLIAFSKKRQSPSPKEEIPVSVIVCAHDEENNLRELVPALLAQDYNNFEIIIVNDRSNDNTYDYLLEETKKDQRLRMVNIDSLPSHLNGKKYAITLGIKAAKSEWVLLTDADCRPSGNLWIREMSKQFQDKTNFVLGVSPYLKEAGFLNLFIRYESLITAIQYIAFAIFSNPYMGVGRNLAYRRSMFLEKKGFHQFGGVTGGDDDLFVNQHANSSTTTFVYNPETIVFSIPKRSWRAFYQQKLRHLSVGKYYRWKDKFIIGLFTATWLVTWFTGLLLLAMNFIPLWIIGMLLLRIVLMIGVFLAALGKIKQAFEWWMIPVLDFLYSIYYLSTGLTASLTKKIQWKK